MCRGMIILCRPFHILISYGGRLVQKGVTIVCLPHKLLIVGDVNGLQMRHGFNNIAVLLYTHIATSYNISVVVALINNYLQHKTCLSPMVRL